METYLIGLLIILIGIVIGLLYFISKRVRDNETKVQINTKDIKALQKKLVEIEDNTQQQLPAGLNQFMGGDIPPFTGEMYEQPQDDNEDDGEWDKNIDLDDDEGVVDVDDVLETVGVNDEDVEEQVAQSDEVVEDEIEGDNVDEVVEEEDVDEVAEEKVDEVAEEEVDEVVEENVDEVVAEEEQPTTKEEEAVVEKRGKNKKFKAPSTKAKEFDVGYQMVSEYDDNTYEVVLDSRNRPRWKRLTA